MKAIGDSTGRKPQQVKDEFRKVGDLGEVAQVSFYPIWERGVERKEEGREWRRRNYRLAIFLRSAHGPSLSLISRPRARSKKFFSSPKP